VDSPNWVSDFLRRTLETTQAFVADFGAQRTLAAMAHSIVASVSAGGKLLVAGNGGSAGDAQHIAAEFVVRLMYDRAPLAAIALTTDSSILTAAGNDYGYEAVFERQVLALGRRGDVFLGISTSGHSANVLRAFEASRRLGLVTLGFSGGDGGAMPALCDHLFLAPSRQTAIVQQIHITAAHIVCGLVERAMFPPPPDAA